MEEIEDRAKRLAYEVSFLNTKEEFWLYVQALIKAQEWGKSVK